MEYTLNNKELIVKINSLGAELTSVVQADTGRQMLWQADPAVWGRHAPLLFPWAGNLRDKKFTWQGTSYAGGQHGFARDLEFALVSHTQERLELVLRSDAQTRERFPFDFALHSIFTLQGRTLTHTVQVEACGQQELRFGVGFHPGFACPFDDAHQLKDYEFRFDAPQSPVVIQTDANTGLVTGRQWPLEEEPIQAIPVQQEMFDNDSICLSQLTAKTISIMEKDTGRSVELGIQGVPYVLLWSKAGVPLRYLCVEPWHCLPDTETASGNWAEKPCTAQLAPGESWQTSLPITFHW